MRNVEETIEILLKQFNLYYKDTVYDKDQQANLILEELLNHTLAEKTLIFRGGGESAVRLINMMEDKSRLKYIIDRKQDDIYGGIPVIPPGMAVSAEADCVLITSYKYRTSMRQEFADCSVKIIDIYEYMAQQGLPLKGLFFGYDVRQNYVEIFYERRSFEEETDKRKKEYFLRRLISRYINIRDFYYAEKYLNLYDQLFGSLLEEFGEEIRKCLNEVKKELAERQEKDILIFWLDQMRYQDLERTQYLKGLANKTLFFENAFSQNLQTSTTLLNMFTGKDLVDDELYRVASVTKENSGLYQLLCENQYDFRYIGLGKKQIRLQQIDTCKAEKGGYLLPANCWKMAMDLLHNGGKSMYICHSFEVHECHYCGYTQNIGDDIQKLDFAAYEKRYYECLDYVDKQMEWYDQFICVPNCHKIIMSDHGQGLYETYVWERQEGKFPNGRWHDDALHVVLMAKTQAVEPKKIKELFSLEQFAELINTLLCGEWEIHSRDYVKIQSMPFYYDGNLDIIQKVNDIRYGMMVLGVRTLLDKYIRYQDGQEAYYILPNENENLINRAQSMERVQELRKLVTGDFEALLGMEKYKKAREILGK